MELKIPGESGHNGASVVWHPLLKRYYAPMAGNVDYTLGVFDATGKCISSPQQKTLFDVRGLWWNPGTKTLQMNGFSDHGWAEYKLDGKGMPVSAEILHEQMNQPDEQSVGAYNPKEKMIYFFNSDGEIEKYDEDAVPNTDENIELHLGSTNSNTDLESNYEVIDDYNGTTVIYTGIPKSEIGLLNHAKMQIELYDLKTGYMTKKLTLPDDAPVEESLNFSFANGIYWLFDKEKRTWKGYK